MDEQTVFTEVDETAFDSGWDNESTSPDTDTDLEPEVNTSAEETETEAESGEQNQPEQNAEAEQTAPDQQEQQTNDTEEFDLNYMGNHEKVGRNEVIALAQKGKDYDRIRGKLDEANTELKSLREQKNNFEKYETFMKRVASKSNTDVESIMADVEASMLVDEEKAKGNNISKEVAVERVKFNRYRAETEAKAKSNDAKEEKVEVQPDADSSKARIADEVNAFVKAYPNVKATDIPQSVWEDVNKNGISLQTAYAKYENNKLRDELNAMKQNQKNSARSTGSRDNAGSASTKDAFDLGWDD